MKILYRGFCNIFETLEIIRNKTAGGQLNFDSGGTGVRLRDGANPGKGQTRFLDLDMETAGPYMREQRDTHGEGFPRIIDRRALRPLIEYTHSSSVAKGFGRLGVLMVEVDESFIEHHVVGPEQGCFCISNANVNLLRFELSELSVLSGMKFSLKEEELRTQFVENLRRDGIILSGGRVIFR